MSNKQTTVHAWPDGCHDTASCTRHRVCTYHQCPHTGKGAALGGEIDAAIAARQSAPAGKPSPARVGGCKHMNFSANVAVARLEDSGRFMAHIAVACSECGQPFQFLGLAPGLDLDGATVGIDGLEARIAIAPRGARPSPLQRMAYGIKRFDG